MTLVLLWTLSTSLLLRAQKIFLKAHLITILLFPLFLLFSSFSSTLLCHLLLKDLCLGCLLLETIVHLIPRLEVGDFLTLELLHFEFIVLIGGSNLRNHVLLQGLCCTIRTELTLVGSFSLRWRHVQLLRLLSFELGLRRERDYRTPCGMQWPQALRRSFMIVSKETSICTAIAHLVRPILADLASKLVLRW